MSETQNVTGVVCKPDADRKITRVHLLVNNQGIALDSLEMTEKGIGVGQTVSGTVSYKYAACPSVAGGCSGILERGTVKIHKSK